MTLTLAELKEQNAKEEADKLALESTEGTTEEVEETEETYAGTVEPWMQEEEAEEQTSDDPSKNVPALDPAKNVPLSKYMSLKKNGERELEKLRSENEALRLATPVKKTVLKRPDRNDFGSDEEHALELSKYDSQLSQETYNRNRKEEQELASQQQAQEAINQAMDSHKERALELMKTSGIPKEKYDSAAENTKEVFNDLFGGDGKAVFKNVFAKLGKGSEKLEYFIGVNRAAQDKIKSLIKSDPLGISLAMWLGSEKQRLSKPIKPRSGAPDPAANLKGDMGTNVGDTLSVKKHKKAYDEAASPQAAYDAKKAAKAAGVDTSKW